ncbi:virion structural protein [Klebsiella phage vB_KpM_FBKp24]|uniref:Virion structural protein n=1 Tax=Klebsiella phage vB_KpM_FBKp24 TaxID=2801834 RepID=A0A7U0J731_9CAUD|nr:virion structural protein [Klebsiella phage vB_KpM_FBKp24]QQV92082.1 virion structural protein [Klebsiella phage vB_KpM_FBKp24]
MFKHSFETSAGSSVFPSSLPGKLLIAKAEGALTPVNRFKGLLAAIEKSPQLESIPIFRHPFAQDVQGVPYTYIDLRPYRNVLTLNSDGSVDFNNEGSAGIVFRRAVLEMAWAEGNTDAFYFNIDVPLAIFAKWLTGLLKNKLNLNEMTSEKVKAITAYYYYCLHCAEADFNERRHEVFCIKISRILNIPFQKLDVWLRPVGYMANLDDYCKALAEFGESLSLKRMDKRILWTLTSTSWFGSSEVREWLAVALEYPPMFIAMIYSSCAGEKQYRKAWLTQLIDREGRGLKSDEFIGRVNDLIAMTANHQEKSY